MGSRVRGLAGIHATGLAMMRRGSMGFERAKLPHWAAFCLLSQGVFGSGVALAQSSSSSVAAQALFDDAKRLVQQGDAASACPKFEESERLEPGIGTKLNLADCYERIGRTASAWVLYLEVEDDTKHNGQTERKKLAHERAAALLPKLSHLTIDVPPANRLPGLTVTRDGMVVGSPQWGLAVPVDPGAHVVVANAEGKRAFQATVSVAPSSGAQTVTVPPLEAAPPSVAAKGNTKSSSGGDGAPPGPHSRRAAGFVTLAVGGVGLVLGTVFGLRAISKNNESNSASDCHGDVCIKGGAGAQARDSARSAGNVSTVAFVIGGAAAATGLMLVLTDSNKQAPSAGQVSAGAFATRDGAELSLRGIW